MQKEITSRQLLLDGKGNIAEPGYAKRLLWEYNRENIVAPKCRIKEWDYYIVTDGKKGAREIIRLKPRETRYIRILGKKRASQFGYSLWEMMVYPAVDNLAFGAKATASSTERNLSPANAVDGRNNTRWGSERKDNEWLMLDLGAAKTIGRLVLRWEQAAGKEYAVQFSQDGKKQVAVQLSLDFPE